MVIGKMNYIFSDIRELLLRELSPISSMNDLGRAYLECIKKVTL